MALADALGCARNTVWRWEAGKTTPARGDLRTLAKALGVTQRWLFYGEEANDAA